ncbi:MAG: aromatase [Chloroflexota bacterium]|nr:aromatase [Chloroflexota bacterium]
MRSTLSVDVAAPGEVVFALAKDVERWPALLPHYLRVRALEWLADGSLVAQMLAVRTFVPVIGLGVPVVWRARTWNEPATHRLRFVHRGGATAGMDVTWRIEPITDGCRVSIDHDFRPDLPAPVGGLWAALVDRLFVRPIASRTLATFKAIAEAAAGEWSDLAPPANQSR